MTDLIEDPASDAIVPVMPDLEAYDAGNEESVKEMEDAIRQMEAFDAKMWNAVLGTYEGRYVLNDILTHMARPFEISANVENVNLTFFREGERNVGMGIFNKVGLDHAKQMNEEHFKRTEMNNV